jgi:hypothetical protein
MLDPTSAIALGIGGSTLINAQDFFQHGDGHPWLEVVNPTISAPLTRLALTARHRTTAAIQEGTRHRCTPRVFKTPGCARAARGRSRTAQGEGARAELAGRGRHPGSVDAGNGRGPPVA